MSVYIRVPCPSCSQKLSLRLEYINRRVVCRYCKHHFLSRTRIKVPSGATPDLIAAIVEANRAQGFDTPELASFSSEEIVAEPPFDVLDSGDHPVVREAAPDPASSDPTAATAIAEAEAEAEAERMGQVGAEALGGDGADAPAEDLHAELERLLVQIEESRSRAGDVARIEAELQAARAESEQLRLMVKVVRADLARRTADFERVRTRQADLERTLAETEQQRSRERTEHARRTEASDRAAAELRETLGRLDREHQASRAEREELREQTRLLAAERDEALRQAQAEQRGRAEEARRQEHEAAQAREHLAQLRAAFDHLRYEREAEHEAHQQALDSLRREHQAKLREAEAAANGRTEGLDAEVQGLREHTRLMQEERDAALALVEDFCREQELLSSRSAQAEIEHNRLESERQDLVAEVEQLRARLADSERARADEASARQAEQERVLTLDAERIIRERDRASAQLREVMAQLDHALGQLEDARRQLAAEREATRADLEAQAELLLARQHAALQQERDRLQAEAERLLGEVELARQEKLAETRRAGELVEQFQLRDTEFDQQRRALEAQLESQARTIEELQIRLKIQLRFEPEPPPEESAAADSVPPQLTEAGGPDAGGSGTGTALALETATATLSDAPEAEAAEADRPAAFTPNQAGSPEERIAALRVYLRRVHEAEEERMNRRLLKRLTRAWRHTESS
jgi:hypothetical protein